MGFRVQVTPADRTDLSVLTSPMRTITKLRRSVKERQDVQALCNDSCEQNGGVFFSGHKRTVSECGADELAGALQFDDLWAQVRENGILLLKLQKQHSDLSRHLDELRELR